jgi:hypothetical protein
VLCHPGGCGEDMIRVQRMSDRSMPRAERNRSGTSSFHPVVRSLTYKWSMEVQIRSKGSMITENTGGIFFQGSVPAAC